MNISVSVVIPSYNRRAVIGRAIDSVLAQTTQPDEIIVVDDGSTDDSANYLDRHYGDRLNIIQQPNLGVSAARNHGITSSNSNWIALLDSDDEWREDKLQQQLNTVTGDASCVLCHTDEIWIRNGIPLKQMKKHRKSGGDIFENCLPLCVISPSSALIKREIFNKTGLFDETLPACEDYDLWLRICAQFETHYIPDPLLIKYGGHEDQLSRKYWGMDRFRIKAMNNLLTTAKLTNDQRQLTLSMLEKKTVILLKGSIKHNNRSLTDECCSILLQHKLAIPDSIKC